LRDPASESHEAAYGTALTVSHLAGSSLPARVIRRFRRLIVGYYAVM
jgi:hypothetical protein